ncbi:MAG TPA: hypothetical protein PLJ35_09075 [Anaerolineae bacterium]|nr:hypothetical protein [Anaerolineae bacterium]HPL27607.1 hypothetical protein [Anaerolineae bacterium]
MIASQRIMRLAAGLCALALLAGCAAPPPATPSPAAAMASPSARTATPAAEPSPTPWSKLRPPAGTVALYGVGTQERWELYALDAAGLAMALGVSIPRSALLSPDGRWLAQLDAPEGEARAVLIRNLQQGQSYTSPLGQACSGPMCLAGLWAFDREGTRLASVEVTRQGWALAIVDLRDGSSRRFDPVQADAGGYNLQPGHPLGWAATGELVISCFTPFSGGGRSGVWALSLPAGDGPIAARRLLGPDSYATLALSPDGTRLLYLARDPAYTPAGYTAIEGSYDDVAVNQLWSLDIASGMGTRLVEVADGGALAGAAAWSPDGHEALFAQGRYGDADVLESLALKAVDSAGAVRAVCSLPAQRALFGLHWCRPDLALAVIFTDDELSELHLMDLATGRSDFVAKGRWVSVVATGLPQTDPDPGEPGAATSSVVDGWSGVVVRLDSQAQFDDYFLRADGEKFGIDGSAAGLSCPLEGAAGQGGTIRVWGRLYDDVPDAFGRQIVVERLEYATGSAPPPGQIVYVNPDGRLRLAGTDGQSVPGPRAYERATALAWSPDGRLLAYVDQQPGGWGAAYVYDMATGRTEPVSRATQPVGQVSWSPDGRYLALDCGTSIVRSLEIVEVATQTFVSPLEAVGYAWSPDGRQLVVGRRRPVQPPLPYEIGDSLSLALVEPGLPPRVLLEGTADVLYRPLAWLPDGRIIYRRTDRPDKTTGGQDSLWTTRLDGAAVQSEPAHDIPLAYDPQALLARLPAGLRDTAGAFSWAPDGRWVTFQAGGYPHWGVYLFDTQTGDAPRCLADGTSPAWRPGVAAMPGPLPTPNYRAPQAFETYTVTSTSPDGLWTAEAFDALPASGGGISSDYYTRLTVARADGTAAWTLVDTWQRWGLGYLVPRPFHWSLDGRSLYFTNRPVPDGCPYFVNGSDLQRVDLQSGHVTQLAPALGFWLALSPDERTLAAGGSGRLTLRDLATGLERELRLSPAEVYAPLGKIVWSPDGAALVLTVANDPCSTRPRTHSIVRVEAATLAATTLLERDPRLFTSEAWPEARRVLLADQGKGRWWLDPGSGELTCAE